MKKKKLSSEVQVAQMQVEHERKVMDAFMECPSENVASVTLEVGGIEHTILIHDEDYPQLYALLCRLNDAENERLTKLLKETESGIGSMKLDTMKQICALSSCNVTESDTAITFKFPDADVIVNRNFDVGMTEAALFVMRGWLKTLREVLDSNNENDGSKNDK